jgi:hypothetical protein
MDDKEGIKQELEQELLWVKYRQKMLDIIEEKLLKMKELAKQGKEGNLTSEELEILNSKLNNLEAQVNALDEESRKIEGEGINE